MVRGAQPHCVARHVSWLRRAIRAQEAVDSLGRTLSWTWAGIRPGARSAHNPAKPVIQPALVDTRGLPTTHALPSGTDCGAGVLRGNILGGNANRLALIAVVVMTRRLRGRGAGPLCRGVGGFVRSMSACDVPRLGCATAATLSPGIGARYLRGDLLGALVMTTWDDVCGRPLPIESWW